MDPLCKTILAQSGIVFNSEIEMDGMMIERDIFLSVHKYQEVQKLLPELEKNFSSSLLTSLHKNANENQKWPLLNLIRQILSIYKYKLIPIRKADGYTSNKIKKYKRFFMISKITNE